MLATPASTATARRAGGASQRCRRRVLLGWTPLGGLTDATLPVPPICCEEGESPLGFRAGTKLHEQKVPGQYNYRRTRQLVLHAAAVADPMTAIMRWP